MQQIEIEYKILLTQDIFQQILKDYQERIESDYIQINDYFSHPLLTAKKMMLRIRTKNNHYELTLKRPYHNHRIETNIPLSEEEKDLFYQHQLHNEITDILKQEDIALNELQHLFSLTTHRYDIRLPEGILSLDENTYLHQHDFELEFEVYDEKQGFEQFLKIIEPYHLSYQHNCLSKVVRAFQAYANSHENENS